MSSRLRAVRIFTLTYEKQMFLVRRPSPAHPPRTCHRSLAFAACSLGKKTTLSPRCRANLCLGPTTASLFTDLSPCGDNLLVDLARCLKFHRILIDRNVITRWHMCLILGRLVAKSGLTCLGLLARLAFSGSYGPCAVWAVLSGSAHCNVVHASSFDLARRRPKCRGCILAVALDVSVCCPLARFAVSSVSNKINIRVHIQY